MRAATSSSPGRLTPERAQADKLAYLSEPYLPISQAVYRHELCQRRGKQKGFHACTQARVAGSMRGLHTEGQPTTAAYLCAVYRTAGACRCVTSAQFRKLKYRRKHNTLAHNWVRSQEGHSNTATALQVLLRLLGKTLWGPACLRRQLRGRTCRL